MCDVHVLTLLRRQPDRLPNLALAYSIRFNTNVFPHTVHWSFFIVQDKHLLQCIRTRAVAFQVDVCDKVEVSVRDSTLDASYYSSFTYTLLDGSGEEISFDSTPAKDPTGEVQVRSA